MRCAALLLAGAAALAAAQTARDDFDCAMRHHAVDFASHIQPFRSISVLEEIAAALDGTPEKAPGCVVNASRLAAAAPRAPRSRFTHFSAQAPKRIFLGFRFCKQDFVGLVLFQNS
jgi:hypothetical protein